MNYERQTQINKMKLKQILTPKQFDEFEKHNEAALILKMLKEKASIFHHVKLLKKLCFYLDLEFVKEALIEIYRTTKSDLIRETITELHDGTLDIEDYLLTLEQRDELNAYAQELDREYENELDSSENEALDSVFLKARLKKI